MRDAGYHYRRAAIANWKVVLINAGMRKGFSYRRAAIASVQGLLGLEAYSTRVVVRPPAPDDAPTCCC